MRLARACLQALTRSRQPATALDRGSAKHPRRIKIVIVLIVFLVGSASALFVLYWYGWIQPNRPSRSAYPVRGIDVSLHQGKIDWRRTTSSPEVQFAYIKASEGAKLRDRRFDENWQGSAGIARGAYHFFSFCTDGGAQARNFLAAAPLESELPPAIDIEFGGNCRSWRSIAQIRRELSEFLSLLSEAPLRKPVLYVNRKSFSRIIRGHFDSHPLWVREPGGFGRSVVSAGCSESPHERGIHRGASRLSRSGPIARSQ
jgi:lysozyme